jgi:hypothetical protein
MNKDKILYNLQFPNAEVLNIYSEYRYDNAFHKDVLGRLSNKTYYKTIRKDIGDQYRIQDEILLDLFRLPACLKINFLRIKLLNEFYSTNVPDICVYKIAQKITENEKLQEWIKEPKTTKGKKRAVDCISELLIDIFSSKSEDEKPDLAKEIYSFATKFCYFSNPDEFSIYDKYVAQLLRDYIIKHAPRFDKILHNHGIEKIQSTCLLTKMKDYQFFMECLEIFIKECDLPQENQQEYRRLVDNYLWLAGMMKYRKDSKVKDMYTKPKKAKQSAA